MHSKGNPRQAVHDCADFHLFLTGWRESRCPTADGKSQEALIALKAAMSILRLRHQRTCNFVPVGSMAWIHGDAYAGTCFQNIGVEGKRLSLAGGILWVSRSALPWPSTTPSSNRKTAGEVCF